MTRRALGAALAAACLLGTAAPADARCAPRSLPQEARTAVAVVEAVLERASEASGAFRTVTVYKGGAEAPARFTLDTRQGRARWPWASAENEGRRYLLFLHRAGDGWTVYRCGASGEASDEARAALRREGLRPQRR